MKKEVAIIIENSDVHSKEKTYYFMCKIVFDYKSLEFYLQKDIVLRSVLSSFICFYRSIAQAKNINTVQNN